MNHHLDKQRPAVIRSAAKLLQGAVAHGRRIPGLGDLKPLDKTEAYAIQALSMEASGEVCGWKIGCTSLDTQVLLGTDEPLAGRLLVQSTYQSPARLGIRVDMPFLECELTFKMKAGLPAREKPYVREEVVRAVGGVMPGIEIIQARYDDWQSASLLESIADNAAHGMLVTGPEIPFEPALDVANIDIALRSGGELIAEGHSNAVLGDPINALVWLANFLSRNGEGIHAGQLVAAGTCTGLSRVRMGVDLIADFGVLGNVSVSLSDSSHQTTPTPRSTGG